MNNVLTDSSDVVERCRNVSQAWMNYRETSLDSFLNHMASSALLLWGQPLLTDHVIPKSSERVGLTLPCTPRLLSTR